MKLPTLSLSQRLLVLTSVALLPALTILGINELSLRMYRSEEIHADAARLAELASLELERVLVGGAALLVAVGSAPVVSLQDTEDCNRYLRGLHDTLPEILTISITGPDKTLACTSSPAGETLAESSGDLIRNLETETFAIGEYLESPDGKGLTIGMRSTDTSGNTTNYVFASISLDYLARITDERPYSKDGALTISDRDGMIIARHPFRDRFVGTRIADEFMPLVTGTESGTREVESLDGTRRIIGYIPATRDLGLYVSAGISVDEAFDPINQATMRGIFMALTGGLIAALLAMSFGRQFIKRPVQRLLDTLGAWRAGDTTARSKLGQRNAEFHQVGTAIDGLLDELDERQGHREQAERHRDLLARELDHRIKNLLATVQAVARQTFKEEPGYKDPKVETFYARLAVMADANALLTNGHADAAGIRETLVTAMAPFVGQGRDIRMEGPDVRLTPKQTLSLAMAVHELCTNAVKYGGLSKEDGIVSCTWRTTGDRLVFEWTEAADIHLAGPPKSRGFGTRMIERALAADFSGTVAFDYRPEGLHFSLDAPLPEVLKVVPTAEKGEGSYPFAESVNGTIRRDFTPGTAE